MRGKLTKEIKLKAKELLGIEDMSVDELRLMPYLQYVMMNEQMLDLRKINNVDRKIFSSWRENGWVTGGASEMTITKKFWDALNELMWISYVDYE